MSSEYKTLTLQQTKKLKHGDILFDKKGRTSKGSPKKWKVISKVKRWVRDSSRIEVGVQFGLYDHFRIDNNSISSFWTDKQLREKLSRRITPGVPKTPKKQL